MDLTELIQISRVQGVIVHRPFEIPDKYDLVITGHHMILSENDGNNEVTLLHRSIDGIVRRPYSLNDGGSLIIKFKDLKQIKIDITGENEFWNVADSLEKLSAIVDISRSYPFYYKPQFKQLEDGWSLFRPEEEFAKLIHSSDSNWRISYVNKDYKICKSYPEAVVVPACITDGILKYSAVFRQGGRFPVLSYRHCNGNVIGRCSQPLIGPNGRRSREDERLMAAFNVRPPSGDGSSPVPSTVVKKGFIIDTRTAATISSAQAKGGGQESDAYYPAWKKINKAIDRYHFLLDSYAKLMEACSDTTSSHEKWLTRLTISSWLTHIKEVLNCGCLVAQCVAQEKANVIVHGSEGADITLCVTSLAQLILNPDCRTVRGFEALIAREWIQAGHPFWSRTTKGPFNDAVASKSETFAPTFVLFLDCVWQIFYQFPFSFEFNEKFLVTLADHAYFSNFGTFLCDSDYERNLMNVQKHTVSLWSYLNRPEILSDFLNCLYDPNAKVIWPSVAPISLNLWQGMYLRWIVDLSPQKEASKKIEEIVERNRNAKSKVLQLRRKLLELESEAEKLGILVQPTSSSRTGTTTSTY